MTLKPIKGHGRYPPMSPNSEQLSLKSGFQAADKRQTSLKKLQSVIVSIQQPNQLLTSESYSMARKKEIFPFWSKKIEAMSELLSLPRIRTQWEDAARYCYNRARKKPRKFVKRIGKYKLRFSILNGDLLSKWVKKTLFYVRENAVFDTREYRASKEAKFTSFCDRQRARKFDDNDNDGVLRSSYTKGLTFKISESECFVFNCPLLSLDEFSRLGEIFTDVSVSVKHKLI